jgi:signal transduction histidine kinase
MIGDKKSFFHILENLLINSFNRTKKYGEITFNMNFLQDLDQMQICIEDSGEVIENQQVN